MDEDERRSRRRRDVDDMSTDVPHAVRRLHKEPVRPRDRVGHRVVSERYEVDVEPGQADRFVHIDHGHAVVGQEREVLAARRERGGSTLVVLGDESASGDHVRTAPVEHRLVVDEARPHRVRGLARPHTVRHQVDLRVASVDPPPERGVPPVEVHVRRHRGPVQHDEYGAAAREVHVRIALAARSDGLVAILVEVRQVPLGDHFRLNRHGIPPAFCANLVHDEHAKPSGQRTFLVVVGHARDRATHGQRGARNRRLGGWLHAPDERDASAVSPVVLGVHVVPLVPPLVIGTEVDLHGARGHPFARSVRVANDADVQPVADSRRVHGLHERVHREVVARFARRAIERPDCERNAPRLRARAQVWASRLRHRPQADRVLVRVIGLVQAEHGDAATDRRACHMMCRAEGGALLQLGVGGEDARAGTLHVREHGVALDGSRSRRPSVGRGDVARAFPSHQERAAGRAASSGLRCDEAVL